MLAPVRGFAQESGIIDGSKNPEAIPDRVAYEHFFSVLQTKADIPAPRTEARRGSYLDYFFRKGCGSSSDDRTLSAGEKAGLIAIAEGLALSLRSIEQGAAALGSVPQDAPALVALGRERDRILQAAMDSVPAAIGWDASEKVRQHVLGHVKAHIKMFAAPTAPGG